MENYQSRENCESEEERNAREDKEIYVPFIRKLLNSSDTSNLSPSSRTLLNKALNYLTSENLSRDKVAIARNIVKGWRKLLLQVKDSTVSSSVKKGDVPATFVAHPQCTTIVAADTTVEDTPQVLDGTTSNLLTSFTSDAALEIKQSDPNGQTGWSATPETKTNDGERHQVKPSLIEVTENADELCMEGECNAQPAITTQVNVSEISSSQPGELGESRDVRTVRPGMCSAESEILTACTPVVTKQIEENIAVLANPVGGSGTLQSLIRDLQSPLSETGGNVPLINGATSGTVLSLTHRVYFPRLPPLAKPPFQLHPEFLKSISCVSPDHIKYEFTSDKGYVPSVALFPWILQPIQFNDDKPHYTQLWCTAISDPRFEKRSLNPRPPPPDADPPAIDDSVTVLLHPSSSNTLGLGYPMDRPMEDQLTGPAAASGMPDFFKADGPVNCILNMPSDILKDLAGWSQSNPEELAVLVRSNPALITAGPATHHALKTGTKTVDSVNNCNMINSCQPNDLMAGWTTLNPPVGPQNAQWTPARKTKSVSFLDVVQDAPASTSTKEFNNPTTCAAAPIDEPAIEPVVPLQPLGLGQHRRHPFFVHDAADIPEYANCLYCNQMCSVDVLMEHYVNVHSDLDPPALLDWHSVRMDVIRGPVKLVENQPKTGVPCLDDLSWITPGSVFLEPLACKLCSHTEKLRNKMLEHVRNHRKEHLGNLALPHSSSSQLHRCRFCTYQHSSSAIFRNHCAGHTGEFQFTCGHCSFRGSTVEAIRRHEGEEHSKRAASELIGTPMPADGRVYGYVCQPCGFVQLDKSRAMVHLKNEHPESCSSRIHRIDMSRNLQHRGKRISHAGQKAECANKDGQLVGSDKSVTLEEDSTRRLLWKSNFANIDSPPKKRYLPSPIAQKNLSCFANKPKVPLAEKLRRSLKNSESESVDESSEAKFSMKDSRKRKSCYTPDDDRVGSVPSIGETIDKLQTRCKRGSVVKSDAVPSAIRKGAPPPPLKVRLSESECKRRDWYERSRVLICNCLFVARTSQAFFAHHSHHHKSEKRIQCPDCNGKFDLAATFVEHFWSNCPMVKFRQFACALSPLCRFITSRRQRFSNHIRDAHPRVQWFMCYWCGKKYANGESLVAHISSSCTRKHLLQRGLETGYPEEENEDEQEKDAAQSPYEGESTSCLAVVYRCSDRSCSHESLERDLFLDHMQIEHPEKTKHLCSYCKKVLDLHELVLHIETEHREVATEGTGFGQLKIINVISCSTTLSDFDSVVDESENCSGESSVSIANPVHSDIMAQEPSAVLPEPVHNPHNQKITLELVTESTKSTESAVSESQAPSLAPAPENSAITSAKLTITPEKSIALPGELISSPEIISCTSEQFISAAEKPAAIPALTTTQPSKPMLTNLTAQPTGLDILPTRLAISPPKLHTSPIEEPTLPPTLTTELAKQAAQPPLLVATESTEEPSVLPYSEDAPITARVASSQNEPAKLVVYGIRLDKLDSVSHVAALHCQVHSPNKLGAEQMELMLRNWRSHNIHHRGSTHPRPNVPIGNVLAWAQNMKSAAAMQTLLQRPYVKLSHLYKCTARDCCFTCNVESEFRMHLEEGKCYSEDGTLSCLYCGEKCLMPNDIATHVTYWHGAAIFQCVHCLFRTRTKTNVPLHYGLCHSDQVFAQFVVSKVSGESVPEPEVEANMLEFVLPLVCTNGGCEFMTMEVSLFKKHLLQCPNGVLPVLHTCFHCNEVVTLAKLDEHLRSHRVFNFQCRYCGHGTSNGNEIVAHLCFIHPTRIGRVFIRSTSGLAQQARAALPIAQPQESAVIRTQPLVAAAAMPQSHETSTDPNRSDPASIIPGGVHIKVEVTDEPLIEASPATPSREVAETVGSPSEHLSPLDGSSYSCGYQLCRFTSPIFEALEEHLRLCTFRANCNSLYCKQCFHNFSSGVTNFLKHVRSHQAQRYSCGLCKYKARLPHFVKTHMRNAHGLEFGDTTCESRCLPGAGSDTDEFVFNPVLQPLRIRLSSSESGSVIVGPSTSSTAAARRRSADVPMDLVVNDLQSVPVQSIFPTEVRCGLCIKCDPPKVFATKVRQNILRHLEQHLREKSQSRGSPSGSGADNDESCDEPPSLAGDVSTGAPASTPAPPNAPTTLKSLSPEFKLHEPILLRSYAGRSAGRVNHLTEQPLPVPLPSTEQPLPVVPPSSTEQPLPVVPPSSTEQPLPIVPSPSAKQPLPIVPSTEQPLPPSSAMVSLLPTTTLNMMMPTKSLTNSAACIQGAPLATPGILPQLGLGAPSVSRSPVRMATPVLPIPETMAASTPWLHVPSTRTTAPVAIASKPPASLARKITPNILRATPAAAAVPKTMEETVQQTRAPVGLWHPKQLPEFVACPNRYRCHVPGCSHLSLDVDAFCNHAMLAHAKLTSNHCLHCTEDFEELADLQRHLSLHGPKLYRCSYCTYLNVTLPLVSAHELSEHPGMPHRCISMREMASDGEAKQVVESRAPYECLLCRKFSSHSRSVMRNHIIQELRLEHYSCNLCAFTSTKDISVRVHFDVAHPRAPVTMTMSLEPQNESEVEQLLQDQEEAFQKYVEQQHGVKAALHKQVSVALPSMPSNTSPVASPRRCSPAASELETTFLPCPVCPFGNRPRPAWRKHLRHHLGGLTYMCQLCERTFHDNYHLADHHYTMHASVHFPGRRDNAAQLEDFVDWVATCIPPFSDDAIPDRPIALTCKRNGCFATFTGLKPLFNHFITDCGMTQRRDVNRLGASKGLVVLDDPQIEDSFYCLCPFCAYRESDKALTKRHILQHYGQRFACCFYCHQEFLCTSDVERHCLEIHPGRAVRSKALPVVHPVQILPVGSMELMIINKNDRGSRDRLGSDIYSCGVCSFTTDIVGAARHHGQHAHLFAALIDVRRKVTEGSRDASDPCCLCPFCNFQDPDEAVVRLHVERHCAHCCGHCAQQFGSKTKVRRHCLKAHPDLPFESSPDTSVILPVDSWELILLLRSAHPEHAPGSAYGCDNCPFATDDLGEARYHGQHAHDTAAFIHLPGARKRTAVVERTPVPVVRLENVPKAQCTTCDVVLEGAASWLDHVSTKHPEGRPLCGEGQTTFRCTTCPFIGDSLVELLKHLKTFHASQELFYHKVQTRVSYNCPRCSFTCNTMKPAKEHVRLHATLLKCSYCNKKAILSAIIQKHCRFKHPDKVISFTNSVADKELLRLTKTILKNKRTTAVTQTLTTLSAPQEKLLAFCSSTSPRPKYSTPFLTSLKSLSKFKSSLRSKSSSHTKSVSQVPSNASTPATSSFLTKPRSLSRSPSPTSFRSHTRSRSPTSSRTRSPSSTSSCTRSPSAASSRTRSPSPTLSCTVCSSPASSPSPALSSRSSTSSSVQSLVPSNSSISSASSSRSNSPCSSQRSNVSRSTVRQRTRNRKHQPAKAFRAAGFAALVAARKKKRRTTQDLSVGVSVYGQKPKPVDWSKLTVHTNFRGIRNATTTGLHFCEIFNLHPVVLVEDVVRGLKVVSLQSEAFLSK